MACLSKWCDTTDHDHEADQVDHNHVAEQVDHDHETEQVDHDHREDVEATTLNPEENTLIRRFRDLAEQPENTRSSI